MAARRGKNQATRNSGHATPAWVWLVLGLLIGLAVYFIGRRAACVACSAARPARRKNDGRVISP